MDPTQPTFLSNKYFLAFLLGSTLLLGTLGSVAADALIVSVSWDERNMVRANAPIFDHRFEPSEPNEDGTPAVGGNHYFRYRYGNPEATGESSMFSTDPKSFSTVDRSYTIGPDTTIPVFYLPDDPRHHTLFIDPVPMFQESARRLVWAAVIATVGLVVIVAVVLRPNTPAHGLSKITFHR
jgi:hypothetical protein